MYQVNVSEVAENFVHASVASGVRSVEYADLHTSLAFAEAVAGDAELVAALQDGITEAIRLGYPVRDAVVVLHHLDTCHQEMARRSKYSADSTYSALLH